MNGVVVQLVRAPACHAGSCPDMRRDQSRSIRYQRSDFLFHGIKLCEEVVMYYTYILYSESTDRYYTGYTSDLEDRLRHHNSGATKTTRHGIPWKIVYYEIYSTKHDAIVREREIKKKRSRKYIT